MEVLADHIFHPQDDGLVGLGQLFDQGGELVHQGRYQDDAQNEQHGKHRGHQHQCRKRPPHAAPAQVPHSRIEQKRQRQRRQGRIDDGLRLR